MARMKKLEKEMRELKSSLYSQIDVSSIKPKKVMHKAATDFLKLKDIQDNIEVNSVELIRKERKHARGY
ncbi:Uncharacterised protein [uncultured archaeon]|nr:Uncharacterised protein [uncultured archaeon]